MTQEQNRNSAQTESGRSMVEMLGVLAIIGVLSVGGIAGYKMAMDNSKANDIVDGISKRAVVLSQKAIAGDAIDGAALATEFGSKISGYAVTVDGDANGFDLTVSGLSKGVCEKALELGLRSSYQITLNDTNTVWDKGVKDDSKVSCTDNNTLAYAFDSSLDGTASAPEEEGESLPTTCPSGTSADGAGGFAVTLADTSSCYCETAGSTYVDGSGCTGTKKADACTSFRDCDKGEYCKLGVDSAGGDYEDDCSVTPGTCTAVGGSDKTKDNQYTYSTEETMTWDAADDWCKAVLGSGHGLASGRTVESVVDRETQSFYKATGLFHRYWLDTLGSDSCGAYAVYLDRYFEYLDKGFTRGVYLKALCK